MSLDIFEDAARAHFSNPPATWQVLPQHDDGWHLVDNHGATLARCSTKAQTEQRRHSGPDAQRWYQRTDWYLGYDPAGRSLTGSEQLVIADVIERVLDATNAFRNARSIRPVRFAEQAHDDDRTWEAAQLPNGRYHVHGNYFRTYAPAELDFLDAQALATFLDDLLDEPAFLRTA